MTKRVEIIKRIKRQAKRAGVNYQLSEGGRHSIIRLGSSRPIPIPRHREIAENTTAAIYKQTEQQLGKDWWKQ
ncbi:hypothetical protein [Corynebacterium belfantii]|uniref:YcfA-like protein n=1 Tax=Corynebacterium belfantii TaxID=2014537 RepID=A0ABS0L9R3_9CORY|nr:hypothetical protein [Corynebacterium belfantii]OWM37109.1 hypothetical protein AZF07_07415 [Corynebacterium diphtheriae subsp. lausannense]MBG9287906.1 hypothetical protein [Corynebacterium belfantii]MBG9326517.1 hypothetical protein [Corynebacterium belfantii]MBG9330770.1 hypothetical protein [Corynebacterium belfantii]MBG9332602.1 hypothetical protein [Corynebacterium belfantii]